MKKIITLFALIFTVFVFACSTVQENKSNLKTQNFVYSNEVFTNPDMGWIFYDNAFDGFGLTGDSAINWSNKLDNNFVQDIAVMSVWSELEKAGDGQFDFSVLDQSINFWISRGKRIHLRLISDGTTFAGRSYGVPEWLYNAPYNVPYYEQKDLFPGITVKFPDYRNEIYRSKLTRFVNKVAERYADNENIQLVDLRGYGMWGEWHTGYPYDNVETRRECLKFIIDTYHNAFSGKKILVLSCSIDTTFCSPHFDTNMTAEEFMYFNAYDYAYSFDDITVRRDGQGGWIQYLDGSMLNRTWESGKKLPIVLEGALAYSAMADNVEGLTPENAIEEIFQYNANYCSVFGHDTNNSNPFFNSGKQLIEKGLLGMGYRLFLNQIRYTESIPKDGNLNIIHRWSNEAFGRAYKNYPLKFVLKNSTDEYSFNSQSFDMTMLENGNLIEFSDSISMKNVTNGSYQLYAVITKNNDSNTEYVRIANNERNDDGQVLLANITVGSGNQEKLPKGSTLLPANTNGIFAYLPISHGNYKITFNYKVTTPSYDALLRVEPFFAALVSNQKIITKTYFNANEGSVTMFGSLNDYGNIQFGSSSGGTVNISNVVVEKIDVNYFSLTSANSLITESNSINISKSEKGMFIKTAASEEEYGVFSVNLSTLGLENEINYVLSLDFASNANLTYGGYYYLKIVDSDGDVIKLFKWHDAKQAEFIQKNFAFTLPHGSNYTLKFGVKGISDFAVKNLIIGG